MEEKLNKVIPLLAFSILLLVPVGAQNAFAHGFVELENVSLTPVSFTDPFDSPFGQNIVIFQPPLAGIDLFVHSNSNTIPFTDTVTVTIREGWGITGNILGSKTQSVTATSGDPSFRDEIHFDFIPPLNLVPGDYMFQIETVEGQNKMQFAVNENNLLFVDSITRGSLNQVQDLNFRTYVIDPLSCGSKTILSLDNQCVPDLTQICGAGTSPDFDVLMCFGIAMETIGGALLDINTASLLVAAIGTNPVITGLVAITMSGVAAQAVWFVHRRKKSKKS